MPQAKPGYEVAVCGREDDLRRCYLGWSGTGRFVTTERFHVPVCMADEQEEEDNVVVFVYAIGDWYWKSIMTLVSPSIVNPQCHPTKAITLFSSHFFPRAAIILQS
jgi:hypothetical protein